MIGDGFKPVTDQEFSAVLSRSVIMDWTTRSLQQGRLKLYPDKTAELSRFGDIEEKGFWSVENNELCIDWVRIRGGHKYCATFFKMDEKKYHVYRENTDFMVTIEEE